MSCFQFALNRLFFGSNFKLTHNQVFNYNIKLDSKKENGNDINHQKLDLYKIQ